MGELPKVDTSQDPSSYFFTPGEEQDNPSFMQKNKPFLDKLHYYLVQIWPYINRALSTVIYFFIGFFKAFFKIIIEQVKNMKGS